MRNFFLAVLILSCVTCAGCFKINSDLIITDDGEVFQQCQFIGNAALNLQIEAWKNQIEKNNPGLRAKAVVEGELRGYKFDKTYPDIETFAESASKLYLSQDEEISQRKGWFFDEYNFDFYWRSPTKTPLDATVNQTLLSQAVFDFSISLPYSAESTNADEVSDGGKFLKWHLSHVTINGGEKYMNVHFKIWHREKIALTILGELLLLAATIFFFIKARAEGSESVGKDFRFKRNVFAILFIALGLISAYLIFKPLP